MKLLATGRISSKRIMHQCHPCKRIVEHAIYLVFSWNSKSISANKAGHHRREAHLNPDDSWSRICGTEFGSGVSRYHVEAGGFGKMFFKTVKLVFFLLRPDPHTLPTRNRALQVRLFQQSETIVGYRRVGALLELIGTAVNMCNQTLISRMS